MIQKILIFSVIPLFFHFGYKKSLKGLYLIIFLLPYEGLTLKNLQLSQFAICGYFAGNLLNHHLKNIFRNNIYTKYILILILLFLFGIINFFTKGIDSNFLLNYGQPTSLALKSYIINFIISILLFILLLNNIYTYQHIKKCLLAFIWSISYFFLTWLFSFILHLPIPSFLRTVCPGGSVFAYYEEVAAFGGYIGETGLTAEYSFFVLTFSLFLFLSSKELNKKIFFASIMAISIFIGISTLMKTYYLALMIFMLVLTYYLLKEKKINLNKKVSVIVLIIIVAGFVYWKASNSFIVKRFEKQIERTESIGIYESKIDVLLHRPYEKEFNNFWEECGLTGIGAINALGVRGNHLATHSHYYDLFMKYGLIGLIIYLLFYFRLLKELHSFTSNKHKISDTGKRLIYILFSLLLSLLVAQYARSYQNQTSFMLNYWFLFGLIAVITTKPSIIMEDNQAFSNSIQSAY